jgi:hypothetical protein
LGIVGWGALSFTTAVYGSGHWTSCSFFRKGVVLAVPGRDAFANVALTSSQVSSPKLSWN